MRPHPGFQFLDRLAALAILALLTLARAVHGQEAIRPASALHAATSGARDTSPSAARTTTPPFRIQIGDARLRDSAELALRTASARVAVSRCQDLLSEFADQAGQPLATRLEAVRMSLHEYLRAVYFVDGSTQRACRGPVAVTRPGSRLVYLCGEAFARLSPDEAWVIIIHEVLHSLGLGERPPSPAFISFRVRERCW